MECIIKSVLTVYNKLTNILLGKAQTDCFIIRKIILIIKKYFIFNCKK